MRICCTGCGFIGSHVVDELVSRGHCVYGIGRTLHDNFNNPNVKYFNIDIINSVRLQELISEIKPELLIHLAGILGTGETWEHPVYTVESNIIGAINVFEACRLIGCKILTVDVGSRWLSPYTISKRCGAEFALAYGNKYKISTGILRIFNVYGPRQGTSIIKIIPNFIRIALQGGVLPVWGNKNADLIHVKDVAVAFANAAERIDSINQVEDIFIGSGDTMTVPEVAEMIVKKIGKGTLKLMPTRVGEEKAEAGFMNNDNAKKYIDWEPKIKLEDGINESIEYYKKVYNYV